MSGANKTFRVRIVVSLVACVLAVCVSSPAHASDPDRPRWTVQVDPLTTALGFVHVQVEAVLSDHWSVYAGPSLHLFAGLTAEEGEAAYTGLGAEAGVRYYFEPTAPQGWWALVRGVVAHLSLDDGDATRLGGYGSVLGGYTWILDGWLVLSAGAGLQYLDYQIEGAGPKGWLPALHTTVGFAF